MSRDERIKELMAQTTTPNSLSLYNAFKQFENEIVQEYQSQLRTLAEAVIKDHKSNCDACPYGEEEMPTTYCDPSFNVHCCKCPACQLARDVMEVGNE